LLFQHLRRQPCFSMWMHANSSGLVVHLASSRLALQKMSQVGAKSLYLENSLLFRFGKVDQPSSLTKVNTLVPELRQINAPCRGLVPSYDLYAVATHASFLDGSFETRRT
jgi:hypothetical protein